MKEEKCFWTHSVLADRLVTLVILVNAVVVFLVEGGVSSPLLTVLDIFCTLFFLIEMGGKIHEQGMLRYWQSGWNRFDGTLVFLSLPSLVAPALAAMPQFVSAGLAQGVASLSSLLFLRLVRLFRFFRLVHVFPNFGSIVRNLWRALRDSVAVFVGFVILLAILSLFSCVLFREAAPQYFGTPWDSVYAIFRMCTVEGWYEIPDAVAKGLGTWATIGVRLYFVGILILGGVIGMSLVNSIFVDAMVSDNNDQLEQKVHDLHDEIKALRHDIARLTEGGEGGEIANLSN